MGSGGRLPGQRFHAPAPRIPHGQHLPQRFSHEFQFRCGPRASCAAERGGLHPPSHGRSRTRSAARFDGACPAGCLRFCDRSPAHIRSGRSPCAEHVSAPRPGDQCLRIRRIAGGRIALSMARPRGLVCAGAGRGPRSDDAQAAVACRSAAAGPRGRGGHAQHLHAAGDVSARRSGTACVGARRARRGDRRTLCRKLCGQGWCGDRGDRDRAGGALRRLRCPSDRHGCRCSGHGGICSGRGEPSGGWYTADDRLDAAEFLRCQSSRVSRLCCRRACPRLPHPDQASPRRSERRRRSRFDFRADPGPRGARAHDPPAAARCGAPRRDCC